MNNLTYPRRFMIGNAGTGAVPGPDTVDPGFLQINSSMRFLRGSMDHVWRNLEGVVGLEAAGFDPAPFSLHPNSVS